MKFKIFDCITKVFMMGAVLTIIIIISAMIEIKDPIANVVILIPVAVVLYNFIVNTIKRNSEESHKQKHQQEKIQKEKVKAEFKKDLNL